MDDKANQGEVFHLSLKHFPNSSIQEKIMKRNDTSSRVYLIQEIGCNGLATELVDNREMMDSSGIYEAVSIHFL